MSLRRPVRVMDVVRTRLLQEPVYLILTKIVVFGRMEDAKPIPYTGVVRAGIEEIEGQEVGH